MNTEFINAFKEMLEAILEYKSEGILVDVYGESLSSLDDFQELRLQRFQELLAQTVNDELN